MSGSGCPRRRRTENSSPGWPIGTSTPPARHGAKCSPASTHPPWSAPKTGCRIGWGSAREASRRSQVPEQTTQALGELARSCHTTVSTVLQGAWAVLLTSLTGTARRRVRHGAIPAGSTRRGRRGVDGRPVDQHGAGAREHHRGHHRHRPARATADRPQRHPRASALGAQRDSPRQPGTSNSSTRLFVYENYPGRRAALSVGGDDGDELTIAGVHQPRVQPLPADRGSLAGPRTQPARRIRHRRLRRGRHRGVDRHG